MICEMAGCFTESSWLVADERRRKKVCRDCRDHLVEMFGWRLVGSA